MHYGVAGYGRYGDILQYADIPEVHRSDFDSSDFDTHRYVVTKVIPAWQEALDKAYGSDPDTKEEWHKGSILLVIKGVIYTFDGLLGTCTHTDYAGIGSGSDYALGALASGKSVRKALEIAADLDPYTGGELIVHKGLK